MNAADEPARGTEPLWVQGFWPKMLKSSDSGEFQKLFAGHLDEWTPISTLLLGTPLRSVRVATDPKREIEFMDRDEERFPVFRVSVPDLRLISKTETLEELMDILVPPSKKNAKAREHFLAYYNLPALAIDLKWGDARWVTITICYIHENRITGIKCTLQYYRIVGQRKLSSPFSAMSVDSWTSTDISKWGR